MYFRTCSIHRRTSSLYIVCLTPHLIFQAAVKRKFPNSQIDGERGLQNNDDISAPVPQKYARFENPNDVHCNVKSAPNFNTADECENALPPLSSNNMPYATVNGHAGEFVKTEDLTSTTSSYNASACDNLERTVPRASPQYGAADFASPTFASRGQSGEKSRTPEFTGTFKQENGLLSPSNDTATSIANGLLAPRTKTEDDFRLLTDIESSNTAASSKEDDLENQLSQFERVLQGIKSRDESSNESEASNEMITGKTQILRAPNQSLGNGLNDSVSPDMAKVNSNQLSLPSEANNTTQLPTSSAAVQQQYGILPSTAQVVQQFLMAHQNERLLASKGRFERNAYLNTGEQNNPRMATQRPNHFPAVRQRVYQQLQQRKNLQLQKSKIVRTPQQLQARNPVMNPLGGNAAYQMHPKVRYAGISPSTQQAVSFTRTAGRIPQNLMQPLRQPASLQQTQTQAQGQVQGQMANLPRHQINMLAQQKLAFQQQMASCLPSYSQAQHSARSSTVMDIRQKFSAGVPSTHSTQYNPLHQQATRAQQPLSHLQHYNPPAYGNQSGPPTRPVQVPYSGDYPGYQHPYQYGVNQENKLHSPFQRHASMDENLVANRFHNPDMNNRNNFSYQRSSSLPGHAAAATNLFNQTSPPVVRLGQSERNVTDMNNNGNEHPSQDMTRIHPQPQLSHIKQAHLGQTNNLNMNQEQLYPNNGISLAQSRAQPPSNLQTPLSNSFTNLLDMKSNSETSLFPFLGQDFPGGTSDSTDFDSLLKSSPSDFDLLNMLECEPSKALQ